MTLVLLDHVSMEQLATSLARKEEQTTTVTVCRDILEKTVNDDDCKNVVCPPNQACVDLVNNHECRCPVGFQGESCTEDIANVLQDLARMEATAATSLESIDASVLVGTLGLTALRMSMSAPTTQTFATKGSVETTREGMNAFADLATQALTATMSLTSASQLLVRTEEAATTWSISTLAPVFQDLMVSFDSFDKPSQPSSVNCFLNVYTRHSHISTFFS